VRDGSVADKFERNGGLDLSHLTARAEARIGLTETGNRYRFRCPLCGNVIVNDQEMPPCCTGPSWTDDHPLEPMERIT
jgi:hypothetical protein